MTLAAVDEIQIHGRVLTGGRALPEAMLGKLRCIFRTRRTDRDRPPVARRAGEGHGFSRSERSAETLRM